MTMANQLMNCLLILCFGFLLSQPVQIQALRIKRSQTVNATTTSTLAMTTVATATTKTATTKPVEQHLVSSTVAPLATVKAAPNATAQLSGTVQPPGNSTAPSTAASTAAPGTSNSAASTASLTAASTAAPATSSSSISMENIAAAAARLEEDAQFTQKLEQLVHELTKDSMPIMELSRVRRVKRQPRNLRRRRHHGSAGATPYVYYNKLVSPDGKHEVKEFELMSPNMMIEGVQQELSIGPEVLSLQVPAGSQDLGGVLLVTSDNGQLEAVHPHSHARHHHRHKSSPVLPMSYMAQQLLQAYRDNEAQIEADKEEKENRRQMETPLYQFMDHAVDVALRKNHEAIERLMSDHDHEHVEESTNDADTEKEKEPKKEKEQELLKPAKDKDSEKEPTPTSAEDNMVISCPIHHDHHTEKNGGIVDDDVVLVNECHLI